MSEFAKNAGGCLLAAIGEQRRLVERYQRGKLMSKDDPRYELYVRHEYDKLKMLCDVARDAGYEGRELIP